MTNFRERFDQELALNDKEINNLIYRPRLTPDEQRNLHTLLRINDILENAKEKLSEPPR